MTTTFPIHRLVADTASTVTDRLATEEPLEIRLVFGPEAHRRTQKIAVTMRTPGHDAALAVGFLWTEGILRDPAHVHDVQHVTRCRPEATGNIIEVALRPAAPVDLKTLHRNFYMSSSCGVCGKASMEAVRVAPAQALPPPAPLLDAATLYTLPERLRAHQAVFEQTGGLHAAAIFTPQGELRYCREDVGRHNALDKVIGEAVRAGALPLRDAVLLVSGRASFELVQKALLAGIPCLAAVGAPSSLAVQLARQHGLTLIGFLRGERANVYTEAARIGGTPAAPAAGEKP